MGRNVIHFAATVTRMKINYFVIIIVLTLRQSVSVFVRHVSGDKIM